MRIVITLSLTGMLTQEMRIDDGNFGEFVIRELEHRFEEVAKEIDVAFIAEEELENDIAFGREEVFCHGSVSDRRSKTTNFSLNT
jgi:hypothetical protein